MSVLSFPARVFTLLAAAAVAGAAGCASQVGIFDTGGAGGSDPTGTGGAGGDGGGSSSTTSSVTTGTGVPPTCTVAADCVALSDSCSDGACINGVCEKLPANENGACDDGQFCTQNDLCQAGVCVGGTEKPCPGGDACHVGSCNETSDACDIVPGNDGSACVDSDPCTLTAFCSNGACVGGQQVDCSFLDDECGVGVCDPMLGCVKTGVADGTPCNDFQFCTINDTCQGGVCGGDPNTCAAPGDVCLIGSCNEANDSCVAVPGPNGIACNDNNACTTAETCTNGLCGGGQPTNQGGACDDQNACTSGDSCSNGVCAGAAVVACIDGDGCCPAGCDDAVDDDCTCNVDLALTATASISSGGNSPPYVPSTMNDGVGEPLCEFAWVSNGQAPSGAWAQLAWNQPVTIGSFYVQTDHATNPICGTSGRNIASATVQYWNGNAWVDATTFSGKVDDVQIDFFPAITTTKLRMFDMTTSPGNGNSTIFEWYVYQGHACAP